MKKNKVKISDKELRALHKLFKSLSSTIDENDKAKGIDWLIFVEALAEVKQTLNMAILSIKSRNTIELTFNQIKLIFGIIKWANDEKLCDLSENDKVLILGIDTILKKVIH